MSRWMGRLMIGMVVAAGTVSVTASEYFVAVDGNDGNPGTADKPLASVAKAADFVLAGDTIWVKKGTYPKQKRIRLKQSGTEKQPIRIWAVEGQKPILDFTGGDSYGIQIRGAWWHLKGLAVTGAAAGGIRIQKETACHNILENITTFANQKTGIHLTDGACDNTILNCDSYLNYDPQKNGENADGFAAKNDIGTGNRFIGCRAWSNSDDGYDCWYAGNPVRFEHCFAWRNGENIWDDTDFQGDGNGFKLGQMTGSHIVIRCAAWDQPERGFDLNGNSSGVTVINCTAVRNPINFAFTFIKGNAEKNRLRNNLSFDGSVEIDPRVDDRHNSWNSPGITITADDFLSLDSASLEGPRQDDGSLRASQFLRLAPGSKAIDAGVDMQIPCSGSAPDLGAFEYMTDKDSDVRTSN